MELVGRKLSRKNVVNWELLVGVFTARAAALLIPLTAGQQLQTIDISHGKIYFNDSDQYILTWMLLTRASAHNLNSVFTSPFVLNLTFADSVTSSMSSLTTESLVLEKLLLY